MTDATRSFIFTEALSKYYGTGSSIGDKVELVYEILEKDGTKGRAWVAEQLFGRAKATEEVIDKEETAEEEQVKNIPVITWVESK